MEIGFQKAQELIAQNKSTLDPFLDLGNLRLRELPEELWELEHLETLCLGAGYFNDSGMYKHSKGY